MKKIISVFIAAVAVLALQTGCSEIKASNNIGQSSVNAPENNRQDREEKRNFQNNNQRGNSQNENSSSGVEVKNDSIKLAKVTAVNGNSITVKLSSQGEPNGGFPQGGPQNGEKRQNNGANNGERPNPQPPQDKNNGSGAPENRTPPNGGRQGGPNFDGEEKTIQITDESIIFTQNGKEQTSAKLADIKTDSILELKYSGDKLVSIVIRPINGRPSAPADAVSGATSASSKAA